MTRRLWVAAVVVLGALGFLVYQGLGNATLYFRTADEAVAQRETLGDRRFRIEGNVLSPVNQTGEVVSFNIESNGVQVPITHKGDPPELFQPGIPVVLEGRFAGRRVLQRPHPGEAFRDLRGREPRPGDHGPDREPEPVNAVLGTAAVALALAGSVLGVITLAMGLKRGDVRFLRAGQRYVWVVLGGAVVATIAMQSALIGHDFSLAYVARNGSRSTPLLYTITGMWSALEGSILLWGLVLAGYLAVMARHFRSRASDPLVAWATLVVLVVVAFFFVLLAGPANPFKVGAGATPLDGLGPNPLLQNHPLVAFHPPMLYLGYVGFTIPFAFAIAALATGRLGEGWLVETRRWTLFAWGFLTLGVMGRRVRCLRK